MKRIKVRNVQINKREVATVEFIRKKWSFLARTKGQVALTVWKDAPEKGKEYFYAGYKHDVDVVRAKTPAKAFAKAVKQFWNC